MKYMCKCCHKEFEIHKGLARDYFYKTEEGYFCSYACMRTGAIPYTEKDDIKLKPEEIKKTKCDA